MRKNMWLMLVALLSLLPSVADAKKQAEPADSVRVLFIGNSFTYHNKMPQMVDSIATSQKRAVSITTVVKGGQRLSGHLENPKLHELLKKGGWDFVIVQEQSTDPALPTAQVVEKVYPSAHKIDSLVMAGSPQAKVIFFMTWGHKYGYRVPMPEYPPMNSYEGMQHRLITSYLEMAYDNDALCAPVGLAWKRVREERPEVILYNNDCYHPSRIGSYLAANVIYTTMFPKRYQTKFRAGMSGPEAEYLQQVAQSTVLDNLTLLNFK